MDDHKLIFVTPYVKPFTTIYYNIPINATIYQKQIEEKIDKMGFPGRQILEVIRESPDTFITGSFLLHFLTEPDSWSPGDIDVFTSDDSFHKKLIPIMKEYGKGRFGFNRVARANKDYQGGIASNIVDLFEWISNKDGTSKFQIIETYQKVEHSIENFDFNLVKSKFDGYTIQIPTETAEAIYNKGEFLKYIFKDSNALNNTLKRLEKYTKRGYNISIPTCITMLEYLDHKNKIKKTFYSLVDEYYFVACETTLELKPDHTEYPYYDNTITE